MEKSIILYFIRYFRCFILVQSHKEGERDTRISQVAKDTKSVVSNYSETSFATTHLTLTSSQWLSKENNFDYSLAKTYTTYLAFVDDARRGMTGTEASRCLYCECLHVG